MTSRLHIMPEQCSTCVFGPDTPIPPERFQDLKEQWLAKTNESFQVCHQTAAWDVDDPEDEVPSIDQIAVCRGFWDEMYVKRGVPVSVLQIFERMGWIVFEVPPEV